MLILSLDLRTKQKFIAITILVFFAFYCNVKSIVIATLVLSFFFSVSFSSFFMDGLAKLFQVISISCSCRHV